MELKRNGGAFQPFHREKTVEKSVQSVGKANASATSISTTKSGSRGEGANNGNTNSKNEEKEGGQPQRKQRRCWSPELHRRFLHALQQLGGPHGELFVKLFFIVIGICFGRFVYLCEDFNWNSFAAATPKQIRELMKVDGLTNDEVKSHLQVCSTV